MKLIIPIIGLMLFLIACAPKTRCESPSLSQDQCWFESATDKNRISECASIKDVTLRESCTSAVAITLNSIEACQNLSLQPKSSCISTIARNTLTAEDCVGIEDGYWRDICLTDIGINTSTHPLCKTVGSQKLRDNCYAQISEKTGDERVCGFVSDAASRNACYRTLAYARLDTGPCAFNEPAFEEDICIRKIAFLANDSSLCAKIGYVKIRENCLEKLAPPTNTII